MLDWLITMTEQMSSLAYYTVRNLFIRAQACHATHPEGNNERVRAKQKQTMHHKAVQRKSGFFTWLVGCIAFDRTNRMQDDHDVG